MKSIRRVPRMCWDHISQTSADVRHAWIAVVICRAVIIMFFIPADDNIRSYWWILGTCDWAEQRTRSSSLFTLHKKAPGRGNSVRHKSHLREKCSLSNTSHNYPRNKHWDRTCSIFLPHFLSHFHISCHSLHDFTQVFQRVLYMGHMVRDGLKNGVVVGL